MYSTGTATNLADLLDQVVAFCESNGWTRDNYSVSGTGKKWHAHNGSVYVNFKALIAETANAAIHNASGVRDGLLFNVGTGYSGSDSYYNQAGVPVSAAAKYITRGMVQLGGSNMPYHLFAHNGGDSIILVVEYVSGYYQFLAFGSLDKFGTYTGGEYMVASGDGVNIGTYQDNNTFVGQRLGFFGINLGIQTVQGNGLVSVDVDAETGWHDALNVVTNPRRITGAESAIFYTAHGIQPNTLNALHVFRRVHPMVERATSGTKPLSFLGEMPGVRTCTLHNLVPGQQVTLGTDNYRVFPFGKKSSTDAAPTTGLSGDSGVLGFAVLE